MLKDRLFGFWLGGGEGAAVLCSPESGFILTPAASSMPPKFKVPAPK